MPIRNHGIPEAIVVESDNGCYIADHKGLSDQKSNTDSALKPLVFASEFARRNPSFVIRFLTGFTQTDTCWLWTRGKDAYGYGQIATGSYRPPMKTHRASWLIHRGNIPEGAHVLHTCDVRHCVNPEHLFLGDQAANMKDAAAKFRLPGGGHKKLTDADVAAIRARYISRDNGKALAREFGVSLVHICRIAAGTSRKVRPSQQQRSA